MSCHLFNGKDSSHLSLRLLHKQTQGRSASMFVNSGAMQQHPFVPNNTTVWVYSICALGLQALLVGSQAQAV
eukprot:3377421-Amphidinium_carterae.1